MSGGHFDYAQHRITDIIDGIEEAIQNQGKTFNDCGFEYTIKDPDDIVMEFETAIPLLKIAQIYAQRIDWYLSGDDGEDSFRERLKSDLEKLEKENK